MSDVVTFLAEEPSPGQGESLSPWIIGVVDDEPSVFEATRIALEGTLFEGRPISIVYANSRESGRRLVETTPDMACLLLDVVMETEHAGFDLVREIREVMGNSAIRIILRTGQPGYAPPMEVIRRFDINDYKEKSELTQVRLWTAVACAIRSYQQIIALEMNRRGLRMVIEASSEMMRRRGIDDFARGVVTQIAAHLHVEPDGLVCVAQRATGGEPVVVGAAGKYADAVDRPVSEIDDPQAAQSIALALKRRAEVTGADDMALFIAGDDWIGAIYVRGRTELRPLDRELLLLYCRNVSLGFENVRLFEAASAAAYVDRVTGLPTRVRFERTIEERLAAGQSLGVLAIGIDRYFDYVILLGHRFGEEVLRALSLRLAEVQPQAEAIGCLFSDVFAVLLDGGAGTDPLAAMQRIELPLTVGSRTLWVGLSFGYALAPSGPISGRELIRRAETALHKAQQARLGGITAYTPEIEDSQRSRILLAHELREAMENDQIYLCYQPQIQLGSGRVVAVEALLRWRHPIRGPVSPALFIPVAEATGLIADLGKWVTRRACRDMRPFLTTGVIDRVAINISPVQLRRSDSLAGLHRIVRAEGLSPGMVEWEITESALLDGEGAISQLREAAALGYKIALDDFGTGHSSLSMIRLMPLDVVKIDRSFLLEVSSDPKARSMLRSIGEICNGLGLETIAEGVETEEHLGAVRDAGIGNVQGFFYSRPHEPEDLARWLEQRRA
ncbi:MAG: EAL domain-containing protein [Telmatospirillum sp.]|nr:EAL domain-containing protein [Telmatospirillum sp.]